MIKKTLSKILSLVLGVTMLLLWAAPLVAAPAWDKSKAKTATKANAVRLQWPRFSHTAHNDFYEVGWLQQLLNYRGAKLKVDGRFNAKTEAAIKKFQREHGLKADGMIGPKTWAKLIVRLRRGDKNDAVQVVQDMFAFGYSEGGDAEYEVRVDGVFGAQTEKAVRHLQKKAGLKVDGSVGPQTWCILFGGKAIQ